MLQYLSKFGVSDRRINRIESDLDNDRMNDAVLDKEVVSPRMLGQIHDDRPLYHKDNINIIDRKEERESERDH